MTQTATENARATGTDSQLDIQLHGVSKFFDKEAAVQGIDLGIRRGEFFSILGPSGCGKTTLLRLVAGFETPSSGEVLIQGQSMTQVPPYRRPVNTVFQSYALFNHLTVWDNVAFGLRVKRQSKTEIRDRVAEALKLVKMGSYARRSPKQLSGGQQQRVALARALVNRPAVLLLDEPLGALDLKLRKEMQVELSNLHQDLGLTFIMVTHDQNEAMSLSDRIAVMDSGRIEQIGSPSEIYERPRTPFVADFIGDTNLFQGRPQSTEDGRLQVETAKGLKIQVQQPEANSLQTNGLVAVSVRPEKIRLSAKPADTGVNCFEGRLKTVMYLGTHVHYIVELLSGDVLTVMSANITRNLPDANTPIYAFWSPEDCLMLNLMPSSH